MSRRKEPFPSSIEGCEALLHDITFYSSPTFTPRGVPTLPYHPATQFRPTGALLGEYSEYEIRSQYSLNVSFLSNPLNLKDSADVLYCVTWAWKPRRLGAEATLASLYFDPRGEGYTEKRIAAMTLFNLYHVQTLPYQGARQAWEERKSIADSLPQLTPAEKRHERLLAAQQLNELIVRSIAQIPTTQPTEEACGEDSSYPAYVPKHEIAPAEPTDDELGLPPAQPQYEQPPWRT